MDATIKIDTSKNFRLNNRVLLKDDGDDVLAFNPESLAIHQLNTSLALVAKLCDGQQSCEQMVVQLMESFDLDSREAAKAVYESLSLLSQYNLLEAA